MRSIKWVLPALVVSATCLGNELIWLVRCTRSTQTLSQLKNELKQQGINVLNSIERSDQEIASECNADEKLQAVYLREEQKSRAKELPLRLREAPDDFKPFPQRRVH
ncbi:MAG: hypothetical protein ACKN9V_06005 [Pseudomonadota bacterium]